MTRKPRHAARPPGDDADRSRWYSHTTETGGTPFVHVGPRPLGVMAPLSNFLNQTTGPGVGGFPSGFQTFPDPVVPTLIHDYNEAWRRKCEVARALSGDGKPFTKANGAH